MRVPVLPPEEIKRVFKIEDLGVLARLAPDQYDSFDPEDLGMEGLGSGAFGVVMAHPEFSDGAIRVSESNDGWIAYACGGGMSPLRPFVGAVAWTGDVWVSFMERLVEPEYEEAVAFLKAFDLANAEDPRANASASEEMREFVREMRSAGLVLDDTQIRNVLKRESDGRLIMNDPVMEMDWAQMEALQETYSIVSEEDPSLNL